MASGTRQSRSGLPGRTWLIGSVARTPTGPSRRPIHGGPSAPRRATVGVGGKARPLSVGESRGEIERACLDEPDSCAEPPTVSSDLDRRADRASARGPTATAGEATSPGTPSRTRTPPNSVSTASPTLGDERKEAAARSGDPPRPLAAWARSVARAHEQRGPELLPPLRSCLRPRRGHATAPQRPRHRAELDAPQRGAHDVRAAGSDENGGGGFGVSHRAAAGWRVVRAPRNSQMRA